MDQHVMAIGADNRVAAIAYAYKKGIARDGD